MSSHTVPHCPLRKISKRPADRPVVLPESDTNLTETGPATNKTFR